MHFIGSRFQVSGVRCQGIEVVGPRMKRHQFRNEPQNIDDMNRYALSILS